ncbi:HAUS augmin-like complex subunit 6 isoform X1 [Hemiscyllium ocellatum]|uniref:HAUS augmin-like complex subunit 6 isoform X1 n=1 Tax=Hemiscyllium ocellatum TaxID=170820 RepID=UPI0029668B0C|nr:HAUS augmin-like complex subunit 6 isoform X1 [Hemiscyllium ocellatum]
MAASGPGIWRKERLWSGLLALGFSPSGDEGRPGARGAGGKRVVFSRDMFDKPNMEAFQVVMHFLFLQLDQNRANSLFRDCWPIYDKKSAASFRKVCFEWMKKIAEEVGNDFPQVTASLLLSPGGPKFSNLIYHFIKYVLMCKFHEAAKDSTWKTMTFKGKQDSHLSAMKSCIATNQFLEGIQREAFVVGEYKRREELMVKENSFLKKQNAEMKSHLEKTAYGFAEARNQKQEEVREMWNIVTDILSELEEEKEVIDSLLEGRVDLYTLDGTDVTLKVPRQLLIKIEDEADQIGDLYKAGKLNLAAIIQLCNSCLSLHEDQRNQVGPAELKQHHLTLEKSAEFLKTELIAMKEQSQKITQEILPSVQASIVKMDTAWDKKWEQYSNRTGCSPVRRKYPVLDLFPNMPPLSFEPSSEEAYKSSIFYTHFATLPGLEESCARSSKKGDSGIESLTRSFNDLSTSKLQCSGRFSIPFRDPTEETHFTSLGEESVEISWNKRQCLERKSQNSYANAMAKQQHTKTPSLSHLTEPTNLSQKTEEPLENAVDQLAEDVADTVTKDSFALAEKANVILDDLFVSPRNPFTVQTELPRTPENLNKLSVNGLRFVADTVTKESSVLSAKEDIPPDDSYITSKNPFTVRTELPRTPENLITDIRNSWRCAVQESELELKKHQEESVSIHPKHGNPANGQFLLEAEGSASASENQTGSNDNTLKSTTPPLPCSKQNNWEESKIDCSNVGSENEPHHSSNKVAGSDAADTLIHKNQCPHDSQSLGEDCAFTSKTSATSNATITSETVSDHLVQFLALDRLSSKSPIKKEKLSKSFVMEMCKYDTKSENVGSFSSSECDLDRTVPWNGSRNFDSDLSTSIKLRFGILQETIPDVLDDESLNSSRNMEVGQLDDYHLDIKNLRSRFERVCKGLATTVYDGSEEQCSDEHTETSDFYFNGNTKNDYKAEHLSEIVSIDDETGSDKLFSLETEFLKDLSLVSLEFPPSLGGSLLNDPVVEDDVLDLSEHSSSKNDQSLSAIDCEKSCTSVGQ